MRKTGYRCDLCGAALPLGEVFYSNGVRCICGECADGITTEELMHLTGAGTSRAMLTALGFAQDLI